MNFYTDVIMKDPRFKSPDPCRDIQMLEPGTRAATLALLAEAHALGHDLRVAETFRSSARQAHLFELGYTKLRTVGVHKFGLAVDFSLYVNGIYENDGEKFYTFLLALGKKHLMVSGIDWGLPRQVHTFHDWDHLQRVPRCRQQMLFAGTWYPPEVYDPFADQKAMTDV